MPVVNFDFKQPAADGTDDAITGGVLSIVPTAAVDAEGHITLPIPFDLPLVAGEASATLATNVNGLWAWRITLNGVGSTRSWVKAVPASGPVDFDDLVDIDPETLAPVTLSSVWAAEMATKQPLDSDLTSIAALTTTAYGRAFLTLADAAAARTATGAQASDADLTAIAALTSAADKLPYATGAGAWSLADLTAFGRTLLDDTDAATARTTLGIGALPLSGSGSPVGVVTAGVGTLYTDTAKTTGANIWRKDSGSGNTGWVVVDGDTTNRTITSWTSAGVVSGEALNPVSWQPAAGAAGFISVRRINSLVQVDISNLERLNTTSANIWLTYTLPAEFRPTKTINATYVTAASPFAAQVILTTAGVLQRSTGGGAGANGVITYATLFGFLGPITWPTSLPGF